MIKDHYFNSFDGKTIYVKEKSAVAENRSASVVVCLPACCQSHHFFDCSVSDYSLMDYLANRGFKVFVYDRRGLGSSYHPSDGRSITYEVDLKDTEVLLNFVIAQTGVRTVSMVAFGHGTQVGCPHAIHHPEQVEALVLTDFFWNVLQPLPPEFKEILLNQPYGYLQKYFMVDAFDRVLVPFVSSEILNLVHSTFIEGPAGRLLTAFEPLPLIKPVEKIQASILIIRGTKAEITSEADSLDFLSKISSQIRAIEVLEGAGPGPRLEKDHY